jgi:hypothetical protein
MDSALMDVTMLLDQGLAISMGLALAATCGLRAFLPLLVISALAAVGKLDLAEGFRWMSSPAALVCFSTAVIAETLSDKVPVVDHALDAAGVIIKPTAAALATASMVHGFEPMLAMVLGVMTGGVAAEAVHVAKAKVRLMSSALTGTVANPILSVGEDGMALLGVVLSILAPVLGLAVMLMLTAWLLTKWQRRRASGPITALASSSVG